MTHDTRTVAGSGRMRGMSMVELLVALTIGSFLMWGAITVYSRSRTTYQVSEQISRLQENARYAVSVIEPDLRLGNLWGLMNDPTMATGYALPTQPASPLSGTTTDCGTNFALNLIEIIRGDNNAYTLGPARAPACNAYNNNAQPGADTITVRRVTEAATVATNNTLQLYTTRSASYSQLFENGVAPGPLDINHEIHDIVVDTYYIDADSVGRPGIPALRRISLISGPAFTDQEVISGVEDLQVQFGIDLGRDADNNGVVDDVDNNGLPDSYTGIASQYVNPDSPLLTVVPSTAVVVSVRFWLLIRSETAEQGFVDRNTYRYADRVYTPGDNFRRLLVSRTVQLRNTIGISP
jgi:type IV pilus assembly protein PilW